MAGGGYQQPSSPAPASGPGRLSKRTDGGPAQKLRPVTGLPYGDNQEFVNLQRQAPMAQTPAPSRAAASRPPATTSGAGSALVPLSAPSSRPDEPVTAGADAGPGPGMDSLRLPNQDTADAEALRPYLPALEAMASLPGASPLTKNWVRRLRGALNS